MKSETAQDTVKPDPSIRKVIEERLSLFVGHHQPPTINHQPSSTSYKPLTGGCINNCYRINRGNHVFFCKINSAVNFPQLFEKEKNGLQLLSDSNAMRIPGVVDCFEYEEQQILILEWINQGERTAFFWKTFGESLAKLHNISNENFGWKEDNYMGNISQSNQKDKNWISFLINQRFIPILDQCLQKNLVDQSHVKKFEKLYGHLDSLFESNEIPSLVHGDLWNGNFICNENSDAVLIDPAVYYGHASVDLGMTDLFGGFPSLFYEAYHYHKPFPVNHKDQWAVCNLYPLLIHLLVFGGSYLSAIEKTINKFS